MTDTYYSATSYDALAGMLTTVQNGTIQLAYASVIGPLPGRAAVAAGTDASGATIPAQPAAGDPALWYIALRTDSVVTPPTGVSPCELAVAQAVLGVWA
jgi:hypothetical protein